MGRGTWRLGSVVAAIAALLSGCASSDHADYSQPSTYQTVAPQTSSQPATAGESKPVEEVDSSPTPTPYKPVLKTEPAEPVAVQEYLAPSPTPVHKTETEQAPSAAEPRPSQPKTQDVAALIQASRAAYPGNCACPYDRDRAGRKCGKRSAYSRAGGYSVLCYPSDVQ